MNSNWPFIFLIVLLSGLFIFFLIKRNRKDEKDLIEKINQDYKKSKDEEGDVDTEEITK